MVKVEAKLGVTIPLAASAIFLLAKVARVGTNPTAAGQKDRQTGGNGAALNWPLAEYNSYQRPITFHVDYFMIATKLSLTPLSELRYVIPVDLLNISTQREVAALHVAEHWLLEGFGDYSTANEGFGAAERLGGYLTATTSRLFIQFRCSYMSPWHKDAAALLGQVLQRPHLDIKRVPFMIDDVVEELNDDDPPTRIFYRYYRDTFTGRYSWPSGGRVELVRSLKAAEVYDIAQRVLRAPVKVVWAGASDCSIMELRGRQALGENFKFTRPLLRQSRAVRIYRDEENGLGLMPIDIQGDYVAGLALNCYMRVRFPGFVLVRQHVLPGMILRSISYDLGDVDEVAIKAYVCRFNQLANPERRHFFDVAAASMKDELSSPSLANEQWLDGWVYGKSFLEHG